MLMKNTLTILALTSIPLLAGSEVDTITPPPEAPKQDWFTFSLEARARLEQRNQQGLDNSFAATLRARPGIQIGRNSGFSAFIQSEHTVAFIDDFQVGTPQSALFDPFEAGNTAIADPENHELNQAYIQYKNDNLLFKVGRQKIIYDNAAFIGNVGWRQNEQTFDAARIAYNSGPLTLDYSYVNRVNRIFGKDGFGAVEALEGDAHLFNASYKLGEHKLHGYAYLLDFSERQFARASSNTYGTFGEFSLPGGKLHAEVAFQTEAGDQDDYTALYAHLKYSQKVANVNITTGIEYLTEDFVTPLATVHAFNGFADVFIANRLGLTAGPAQWDGITDIYVGASTKTPSGIKLAATAHAFYDDQVDQFYGWEIDAVAAKKLTDNVTALAKFAYFVADDSTPFTDDVSQFSVQLDYKF